MTERNVINGTFGGIVTYTTEGFFAFLQESGWMLFLGFLLILVDLHFGIEYAKKRNELIKRSRAIRRTLNKTVDYFCWIALAYVIGQAFGEAFGVDTIPHVIMAIIYFVELESVATNYFGSKGKRFSIDFTGWFKRKTDIDVKIDNEEKQ